MDSAEQATTDPQPRPWWIYRGSGERLRDGRLGELLPPPPPWRRFDGGPVLPPPPDDTETARRLGAHLPVESRSATDRDAVVDMVNAALLLRRPLLVTGRPGTGKTSLAFRISHELRLGRVLSWHITSSSTLRQGLYDYDAIARVQDAAAQRAAAGESTSTADVPPPTIGDYIQLGPLGTALLPYAEPRVLLVDELDKSNVDLANDLLSTFEDGRFRIRELQRARNREPRVTVLTDDPNSCAEIVDGLVTCQAFPLVIMTSNGERDFPPAFLRRCLVLRMPDPDAADLAAAVTAHYGPHARSTGTDELIGEFLDRARQQGGLAVDQFLNAVHLRAAWRDQPPAEAGVRELARKLLWHRLDGVNT